MQKFIPLDCLEISPENSRKTMDPKALGELRASIVSHGLMQNLVVIESSDGDVYHVIAGARRLTVLKQMRKSGDDMAILKTGIPCLVVPDKDSFEKSLAENIVRQNMNPVDEFEAFAYLAGNNNSPRDIAMRFGVTEKHVLGRMKLAKLHPDILAAFRKGQTTLERVVAFTITDNKQRQLKVFKNLSDYTTAQGIRRELMEGKLPGDSYLAKFVGLREYHNAGGTSQENLFGDDVYLNDMALLNKMAAKKLEKDVEALKKEGWGWVEVLPEEGLYRFIDGMTRIHNVPKKKAEKALLGVVLMVDNAGRPEIHKAYLKKSDASAFKKIAPKEDPVVQLKAGKEKGAPTYALTMKLREQRQEIMQLAIAGNPQLAMDLLLFAAAQSVLDVDIYGTVDGLAITFDNLTSLDDDEKLSKNGRRLLELQNKISFDWQEEKSDADRFMEITKLSSVRKCEILSWCVAAAVEGNLSGFKRAGPTAVDAALSLCGLKVEDYWRPTRENYLSHISRDQLLALGAELFGDRWKADWKNANKEKLATELEHVFADPSKYAAHSPDKARKIFSWLPEGMAFETLKPLKGIASVKRAKSN